MKNIWEEKEPDFINEDNIKWWYDESLSDYSIKKDINNISLPHLRVWITQKPNGSRSYVIVDHNENVPVYEDTKMDGIATKIDMLKVIEYYE